MVGAMARPTAIPKEFEDLLTPAGQRVLRGGNPDLTAALADPRRRFVALDGMISKKRAEALRRALDADFHDLLTPLAAPIPPETINLMRVNNDDWLPKTIRVRTAYLENRRSKAYRRALDLGLVALLRSESLRHFAEIILGRGLDPKGGQQIICYGTGDYSGPHTDHHPRLKRAAQGYLDIHFSLTSPAVLHQYVVYAKGGHWSEIVPVHRTGCLTIYRLPFWHMTTPLAARPGLEAKARRWLLLGTFFYR
jgi:hypothetical protein